MSQIEKLIEKMQNYRSGNPIEFSEIEKYLIYYGFEEKNQSGTSHIIFTHKYLNRPFPIPKHGNKVKAVYVKKAVELVEWVKEKEGEL